MQRFIKASGFGVISLILTGVVYSALALFVPSSSLLILVAVAIGVFGASYVYIRGRRGQDFVSFEASNVVNRVLIQRITKVISIDDLEDFGPGYYVVTANEQSAIIIGQVIADVDSRGEGLPTNLILEVDSGSKEILVVHGDGDEIPVTLNCSLQSVGIDVIVGFSLCDPFGG
ncbi:hypothetical protein AB1L42_18310 [Thalassoglobus sp. JC818]|uniref:hypothetical protein n=1 Tax=Thalassoglobus sp. JC818 TaxID=3232136 RepID=UPI0034575648